MLWYHVYGTRNLLIFNIEKYYIDWIFIYIIILCMTYPSGNVSGNPLGNGIVTICVNDSTLLLNKLHISEYGI